MDFPLLIGIFPQVLLDGLVLGFMYALIALGYTMVYGVLEFINFAHSEIFVVGAFVGVEILLTLQAARLLAGAHPAHLGHRRVLLPPGRREARREHLAERLQPRLPDDGHAQHPVQLHRDHRCLGEVPRGHRALAPHAVGPPRPGHPHQDRQGHPRRGRGPGDGQPHGDQCQPDDLPDLPHRRRHGRGGRRALRRPVQPDQPVHGLHPRPEGLHRRGARRHRQYSRGHAGRARPRAPGGVRGLVPVAPHGRGLRRRVQGHLRLLHPHPDPHLPAQGSPRRGRQGARVITSLLSRPVLVKILMIALLGVTAYAVSHFPRSIVAFMLFQTSILLLYFASMPAWLKGLLTAGTLGVLMPVVGSIYGYGVSVAIQAGIFVALALGLNIVVGLAGLLDLGYVAFFAVGAYTWAIFGSPHANIMFGGGFPLAPGWFYAFLLVGLLLGAGTGVLLGLPVLRLRGDYLAIVTLGFGEGIRALANTLDKPVNITNGPKGITPISRPPVPFDVPYAEAFYFLVLLILVVVGVG